MNNKSTLFWISIAVAEFFVMACVFDAFLYSKNSGLIFTAKQKIIRPKERKYEIETQGIFCVLFCSLCHYFSD